MLRCGFKVFSYINGNSSQRKINANSTIGASTAIFLPHPSLEAHSPPPSSSS